MRMARALAVVLWFCAPAVLAQDLPSGSLPKHAWEFGVWAGGGHSVPGGTTDVSVFNAGLRVGKVLTAEHGSRFLRGNLEYAVDLIPVYLFHRDRTTYAAGFNPFIVKWNFTSGRLVAPYAEFGGGILVSSDDIPPGTSTVNFMPQASLGFQFFTRPRRAVVAAAKYVHISNAGLASPNPGINTAQFTLGYHWYH